MDATDTGYGFSMNGIQPIGTITTGNKIFRQAEQEYE